MPKLKRVKLDVYALRAAEIFHVAYGQVTIEQRQHAKIAAYAQAFGARVTTDITIPMDN